MMVGSGFLPLRRLILTVCVLLPACSVDSARQHYLMAERLWNDKNYPASVVEFERVIVKDPKGVLGAQALYRAATTQTLFLSQHVEAVQKLRSFVQLSTDSKLVKSAQNQIGDILFHDLESYEQAILHYRSLIKQEPQGSEVPSYLFRIAKSHFFLFQFDEALQTYQTLISRFPNTLWKEKASLELGTTYYTRGHRTRGGSQGRDAGDFERAISAYRHFIQAYPKSEWVAEARFGIASAHEELDELEKAYAIYAELKKNYPSPQVIEIKLYRIKERLAQRRNHK